MGAPVNDPISLSERVVRSIYFPSQEDKKGKLKKYATFPVIKEDRDEPEYINNKLSLLRVCMASATHEYSPVVESARYWEKGRKTLKGFLEWSCREIYEIFGSIRIDLVPAATEDNPYHFHLEVKDLKIEYTPELRESKSNHDLSYTDLYPPCVHAALLRLRERGYLIRITDGKTEGSPSPCDRCKHL